MKLYLNWLGEDLPSRVIKSRALERIGIVALALSQLAILRDGILIIKKHTHATLRSSREILCEESPFRPLGWLDGKETQKKDLAVGLAVGAVHSFSNSPDTTTWTTPTATTATARRRSWPSRASYVFSI
jgi:hypothetical protein